MKAAVLFSSLCLLSFFTQAQTNYFPTTGFTSIGAGAASNSASTGLHIKYNSTTLNSANFITLDNRGANAQYSTTHVLGGILFSGFRDIRSPANVAGIWAVRTSSAGGLASQGDIVFGTAGSADAVNIAQDNALPAERMRITYDGKVGIGTSTPNANSKLNVDPQGAGTILLGNPTTSGGSYTNLMLGISAQTNGYSYIQGTGAAGSSYGVMALNPFGGNVLIGKTSQANSLYSLDINGAARANKVVVNTTGADFVFDSTYELRSLSEVERYINLNKHLPEIAPAADMQKEGLDLGENQTKLLQKIEELTLYIIEQNKKIEAQDNKIQQILIEQEKLHTENIALQQRINKTNSNQNK